MGMSSASASTSASADAKLESSVWCCWCWWRSCLVGFRIEEMELRRAGSDESRAMRAGSWMAEKDRLREFGETEVGGCVGEG